MSQEAVRGRDLPDIEARRGQRMGQAGSDGQRRSVRDADWVWRLNDESTCPHIFALGVTRAIANARRDGGDVATRVDAALDLVGKLVEDGRIRPSGSRDEPRTGLEMFADAVERLPAARAGARLGGRRQAHEALERLQGMLSSLAAQQNERLKRPRPLGAVALAAGDDLPSRRLGERIEVSTDPIELRVAWRLTARQQLRSARQFGPADERSLAWTRGLEALTARMRVLGVEPPTLDRPRGRSR